MNSPFLLRDREVTLNSISRPDFKNSKPTFNYESAPNDNIVPIIVVYFSNNKKVGESMAAKPRNIFVLRCTAYIDRGYINRRRIRPS